jgi:hypothetical protein
VGRSDSVKTSVLDSVSVPVLVPDADSLPLSLAPRATDRICLRPMGRVALSLGDRVAESETDIDEVPLELPISVSCPLLDPHTPLANNSIKNKPNEKYSCGYMTTRSA